MICFHFAKSRSCFPLICCSAVLILHCLACSGSKPARCACEEKLRRSLRAARPVASADRLSKCDAFACHKSMLPVQCSADGGLRTLIQLLQGPSWRSTTRSPFSSRDVIFTGGELMFHVFEQLNG